MGCHSQFEDVITCTVVNYFPKCLDTKTSHVFSNTRIASFSRTRAIVYHTCDGVLVSIKSVTFSLSLKVEFN